MKHSAFYCLLFLCSSSSAWSDQKSFPMIENSLLVPPYLYKVVSLDQWEKSKTTQQVTLGSNDTKFIHFSTKEQVEKIIKKKFDKQSYVSLKIQTSKLPGTFVLEAKKGEEEKFYHLYNGYIPLVAVVESYTHQVS